MKETREIAKHIPVLMEEVLEALNLDTGKSFVDATLGGGGHTRAILQSIAPTGKLLSLDQDAEAITAFQEKQEVDVVLKKATDENHLLVHKANFSKLGEVLEQLEWSKVDGIMADLGYSSDQIEDGARGLSFMKDGPLDMRLDQSIATTAEDIVMTSSIDELTKIFRLYGEEEYAYNLAQKICEVRSTHRIDTTRKLAQLIEEATPAGKRRQEKIHPATKVFQALRIAVNQEYDRLKEFLEASVEALDTGGRLAIISFHSGEDRIVKEFFQTQAKGCICPREFPICICGQKPTLKIVNKKVIIPSDEEVSLNPRSRSAKLRIAQKI